MDYPAAPIAAHEPADAAYYDSTPRPPEVSSFDRSRSHHTASPADVYPTHDDAGYPRAEPLAPAPIAEPETLSVAGFANSSPEPIQPETREPLAAAPVSFPAEVVESPRAIYPTHSTTNDPRSTDRYHSASPSPRYGTPEEPPMHIPNNSADAILPARGSYTVQPGDSYSLISRRIYGVEAYFKALAEHNRKTVPMENKLDLGVEIETPSITELERLYPTLCPSPSRRATLQQRTRSVSMTRPAGGSANMYTVQQGDNLFTIARYELGNAGRWIEIYKINRQMLGDDYNYLTPGMELVLPNKNGTPASEDAFTRRPEGDGVYHR